MRGQGFGHEACLCIWLNVTLEICVEDFVDDSEVVDGIAVIILGIDVRATPFQTMRLCVFLFQKESVLHTNTCPIPKNTYCQAGHRLSADCECESRSDVGRVVQDHVSMLYHLDMLLGLVRLLQRTAPWAEGLRLPLLHRLIYSPVLLS